MPQGEEPPRRPRRPLQPYVETVIDVDDVDRQSAGGQQNPTPIKPDIPKSDKPVHGAPTPGQSANPSNTGSSSVGGRAAVNVSGGPTVPTFGSRRDGPRGFGRSREEEMHPSVATPVSQNGGPRPFIAQRNDNSRSSNLPPPRGRSHDQSRSPHMPRYYVERAQQVRRDGPRQGDIVSHLYNLFRDADYNGEEEPEFKLLNGHRLRGLTRAAYDQLPMEDQVAARPHLRGRFLLSTGMSQEEVNVAVEMEMEGEDERDIEATICSMRAAAAEGW
ncbi:hypothetical protein BLS_004563 [Venturia inaequalis]|uniref:Uncharacterized protein n=1 Tax=Venturia inaequalis TaxID=5025 RepID=A0A8H3V8Z4_VENIN|nr:hypothetical protein BLS_004563 [Venturia inaequalis]